MKSLHLSFLFSLLIFANSAESAQRPNVLLIAIDDLNDWVGCLGGHPQARTPHIDALASRSTLFANAHCQAPICNPSRTSVLLGLRPSTTGIYRNSPWFRKTAGNKGRITLPQQFGETGYITMTAGKIYHGSRVDPESFQTVGPRPGQRLPIDKTVVEIPNVGSRLWDYGVQDYPEAEFGDFVTASWAIEQLDGEFDKPFFMAVGLYRPHVPWYAPKSAFDLHPISNVLLPQVNSSDLSDLPQAAKDLTRNPTPPAHRWFVESGQWDDAVQAYLASTSFTDAQVGRIIEALDRSPHAENTIVVLFSDHGFHLGEKERWAKQSLWERSTRVPLVIRLPGQSTGLVCQRPVELLSIYPTLLELCEVDAPGELDGVSIVPLLHDSSAAWTRPAVTTYQQNNHAVRSERYRYIRYVDGSEELYDHQTDPQEWVNLASDEKYASVIEEHARWLPSVNVADAGKKNE